MSRSAVTPVFPFPLAQVRHAVAEPLTNNSVYPKNHNTERKIVEKGKLNTKNFSGAEVQETGKIKRKEDLGTRVGERPVRRACSVHEESMLMKSRSRQAFQVGQGVGDIEGTPTVTLV